MKTQRSARQIISTVEGRSGFGWNDNLKMVTSSPNALAAYVKQYPAHEKFLNHPVENYEDMSESVTYSETISHRKRPRDEEETSEIQDISRKLGEVVSALNKFSNNQLDVNELYQELMKMDDVEEGVLLAAFDHLIEREMLAKAFLTKTLP